MVRPTWKTVMCVAVLVLLACLGVVLLFGQSRVGEFNPDTLGFRVRSAWGLPLTDPDWRVTLGPTRSVSQRPIVAWLVAQGYWTPGAPEGDAKWRRIYHYGREWRDGHGAFVWDLLLRETEWKAWTASHPDWAPRFWPRVLETLRSEKPDAGLRFWVQLAVARRCETWEEFLGMEAEWMEE